MNRNGFALIAALWLLVALSLVGLVLSLRGRARRLAAANAREAAQGRAAAGAGVAHARALLERRLEAAVERGGGTVPMHLDPWRELGSVLPDSQPIRGGWYRVRLRDAGAALNLNRCAEDELRRLLVALRVDAGDADRIAQAAMDWRDADHLRRGRGAEREDYVRAGAADLPSNGAREDEVRRLQVTDLDFAAEVIDVPGTKTDASARTVPMRPQLCEILLPYISRLGRADGPLFTTAAGAPVRDWRKTLDAIAERAGFQRGQVRTRLFRTSYITHRLACIDHGAPIDPYQVAREVGHSSLTMIMKVYGRVQRRRVRMEELAFEWKRSGPVSPTGSRLCTPGNRARSERSRRTVRH